jgi:hypothetical protein
LFVSLSLSLSPLSPTAFIAVLQTVCEIALLRVFLFVQVPTVLSGLLLAFAGIMFIIAAIKREKGESLQSLMGIRSLHFIKQLLYLYMYLYLCLCLCLCLLIVVDDFIIGDFVSRGCWPETRITMFSFSIQYSLQIPRYKKTLTLLCYDRLCSDVC